MTEYWKSNPRKFCPQCKVWITDNKISVQFHESGKKHKENVAVSIILWVFVVTDHKMLFIKYFNIYVSTETVKRCQEARGRFNERKEKFGKGSGTNREKSKISSNER